MSFCNYNLKTSPLGNSPQRMQVKDDGFPIQHCEDTLVVGLAVCWGGKDAYYISLQQMQDQTGMWADRLFYQVIGIGKELLLVWWTTYILAYSCVLFSLPAFLFQPLLAFTLQSLSDTRIKPNLLLRLRFDSWSFLFSSINTAHFLGAMSSLKK